MTPNSPTSVNIELMDRKELHHSDIEDVAPGHLQSTEDLVLDRKLRWKLDWFILPLIASVYFFASMGRSDLSNAKIAGLVEELQLSTKDYSNAASMFLVGYVVFQLPGTLLIKKIQAPVQFGAAMLMWGVFTAITVTVKNRDQLIALRFLIGSCEAFVQGAIFYLSFWYKYDELATRGAVVFSMSTFAGAFNGLISYGIVQRLDGANGWRAWRWIFLIEGLMPVAFSSLVFAFLPSSPATVRLGFNNLEREQIIHRSLKSHNVADAGFKPRQMLSVLMDIHFWLFCIIACCGHFCLGSLSNFIPDIIKGFGYSTVNAQAFTSIVYLCGAVGTLGWSMIADKTNARSLTLAASSIGAVIGYAILISSTERNVQLFATCLVAFSMYPNVVLQLSWAATCFPSYTRRGATLAFSNIFSQVFAIAGTQAYSDPPYYRKGHSASLGLSVAVLIFALVLKWYLSHLNSEKKRQPHYPELSSKSIEELGDKHPDFYYTI